MANPHRHIDYRLLTLAACLRPSLPFDIWTNIVTRARQSRINEMLAMREPFFRQEYQYRVERANMLGVCPNCAKMNCTDEWGPVGECNYGIGINALGRRGLYMAFIWGHLADDYWSLRELCDCDSCEICEWRNTLEEFLSI